LFFILSPFGLEKVPFIKPQNSPASLSSGSFRRASSRRAAGIASPSYNPQIEDALYEMEGRSSASLDRKNSSLERSSSKRTSADRDPFTGKLRRVESALTPPMERGLYCMFYVVLPSFTLFCPSVVGPVLCLFRVHSLMPRLAFTAISYRLHDAHKEEGWEVELRGHDRTRQETSVAVAQS
jgi:hypothetical protein